MAKLEQELRTYFRCEAEAAIPRDDWWQKAASKAVSEQRKPKTGLKNWVGNLAEILRINPQRPAWGIVTYLLLLVVYVGLSAGLTDIVSNFPPGGSSAPPITSQPPSTTIGPSPTGTLPPVTTQPPITITNTTVTLTTPAESMNALYPLIFFLFFIFFVTTTLVILSWARRARDRNEAI
ncbi:hypothetical protein [Dehalogenimonas etheniformans]|uniref:Uncharacterized protein n=1 Tax=Dehalogenimonas etheniformans TaxID=1536648 RepID=A0A2P5P5C1_9CHLR|nr:hypothetical protein [Dehalogenimonas etheniformans]PPD57502.1 hypothetical protein JP09_009245 [Dehalogenimonas etheniformans]QNT76864.1 hypothetical protein HX448_09340 [Dehalogenimonas etheniformans]